MKRRQVLCGLAAGIVLATPALAEDVVANIIRQLQKQGFGTISQERTLLGRVRILAERKDGEREIIINPRTGEILRDLWTPVAGSNDKVQIIGDPSSGNGGNGGKGGGDDEDDDGGDNDSGGGGDAGGDGHGGGD